MKWEMQAQSFRDQLVLEEKSRGTIEKYMRDIAVFLSFMEERPLDKETVILYKRDLEERYAASTANSMLVAMNRFLAYIGRHDLTVKLLKVQKQMFCRREKELSKAEYQRLVQAAQQKGNRRLVLLLQTICATGIRVSDLRFITAEAVRRGRAEVNGKGKWRMVFLPQKLQKQLQKYMKEQKIKTGYIFVTRSGRPMERTNIWSEMKKLCAAAHVSKEKVFPHNLRHLFARVFYGLEKDIAKLADILGHRSIETTRIYIMESGEEHRRRIEKMNLVMLL